MNSHLPFRFAALPSRKNPYMCDRKGRDGGTEGRKDGGRRLGQKLEAVTDTKDLVSVDISSE